MATIDASGDHGPFSEPVAIKLQPVPTAPTVDAPEEKGEDKLHFRWRSGGRGETYQVQVARAPDFADILNEQTSTEAAIDLPKPPAGDYYLRVRMTEVDGFTGPYGATQRFTVEGSKPWWLLLLLVPFAL